MCACRFEATSPNSPVSPGEFEEYCNAYLNNMERNEQQSQEQQGQVKNDADDVYVQLQQKEQDLLLAAQLGKALLERNEELQKKNEQLAEEYAQKLEEMQQQRHELKFLMEIKEGQYENAIKDLHQDVEYLRRELEQRQQQSQSGDRERAQVVDELKQQNERLTDQLRQAAKTEEQLQNQVQSFRDQLNSKRVSMHEHVQQLEMLKEEIAILTERKNELDRRIAAVTKERDELLRTLEESQDRIMMLEKQNREQEHQLHLQEQGLGELREQNSQLQEQLEGLSLHVASHRYDNQESLFNELGQSENSLDMELAAAGVDVPHPRPSNLLFSTQMMSECDEDDDDVECDDDAMMLSPVRDNDPRNLQSSLSFPDSLNGTTAGFTDSEHIEQNRQLKEELLLVYQELRAMAREITRSRSETLSPDDITSQDMRKDHLQMVTQEIRSLIQALSGKKECPCLNSPDSVEENDRQELEEKISMMRQELTRTQRELQKLNQQMISKDEELHQKTAELTSLTSKLELQQLEMSKIQAERDRLQDQALTTVTRDEVIEGARQDRNEAISKRNSMEVELAKAKLDYMTLHKQLMEAIQQKIELSQQLEQWQLDMHDLIGTQMKRQIKDETEKDELKAEASSPKRTFHIFP
ncbi:bicaudal D-related protein homolog isoform X2 [Lingula anatina]|uniref:Bicaudal D-related protein homolog isoform X2 n=1 Tax=Lingula anatina TaxID=7574 RepID=A0A1S3JMG3_LINAN|nr:bicaudal D-related protein homolog isoform X2 [Lingula anatina]|eukprot:XP_013411321.1 bicaudal D-related protein homolog isoform X2 [Lingula anatina]